MRPLLKEAFDFVDADKNGSIEKAEIEGMFMSLVAMMLKQAGITMDQMPEEAQT